MTSPFESSILTSDLWNSSSLFCVLCCVNSPGSSWGVSIFCWGEVFITSLPPVPSLIAGQSWHMLFVVILQIFHCLAVHTLIQCVCQIILSFVALYSQVISQLGLSSSASLAIYTHRTVSWYCFLVLLLPFSSH